ncbi:rRNA uridine synthase [Sesbania bispinosa]|nr:rRNA uridine synthase [Sesbania bispinosa]
MENIDFEFEIPDELHSDLVCNFCNEGGDNYHSKQRNSELIIRDSSAQQIVECISRDGIVNYESYEKNGIYGSQECNRNVGLNGKDGPAANALKPLCEKNNSIGSQTSLVSKDGPCARQTQDAALLEGHADVNGEAMGDMYAGTGLLSSMVQVRRCGSKTDPGHIQIMGVMNDEVDLLTSMTHKSGGRAIVPLVADRNWRVKLGHV